MSSRSPSVNSFTHAAAGTPRPWVPARPIPPAAGYLAHGDTFTVPGLAVVLAHPHRTRRDARTFAVRIARDPAGYLDVVTTFQVPGITDCRPTSHARGGTPFKTVNFTDLKIAPSPVLAAGREFAHA